MFWFQLQNMRLEFYIGNMRVRCWFICTLNSSTSWATSWDMTLPMVHIIFFARYWVGVTFKLFCTICAYLWRWNFLLEHGLYLFLLDEPRSEPFTSIKDDVVEAVTGYLQWRFAFNWSRNSGSSSCRWNNYDVRVFGWEQTLEYHLNSSSPYLYLIHSCHLLHLQLPLLVSCKPFLSLLKRWIVYISSVNCTLISSKR